MLNGKATIVLLIVELIKRHVINNGYFRGANVKVELLFSNHAAKVDWKIATGVDTLDFAKTLI